MLLFLLFHQRTGSLQPMQLLWGSPRLLAVFGHIQLSLWLGEKYEEAGQPAWQGNVLPAREVSEQAQGGGGALLSSWKSHTQHWENHTRHFWEKKGSKRAVNHWPEQPGGYIGYSGWQEGQILL